MSKGVRMWAIVDGDGAILPHTVSHYKRDARKKFYAAWKHEPFDFSKPWQSNGHSVRRVLVTLEGE